LTGLLTVIELFHKKGHTENSLMAYLPKEKVLFTGDNVCESSLPCLDQTCFPEVYGTLDFIINDLDVETIVPGHGAVCTKKETLRFKHWLEDIFESVEREYRNGLTRDEVLSKLTFPDLIHCDTDRYRGYPEAHIEGFRRRSYEHIYDVIKTQAVRT
jgi:glyoxylase-like metal-dependent hydrolase (beta-lactamase superfamily II)